MKRAAKGKLSSKKAKSIKSTTDLINIDLEIKWQTMENLDKFIEEIINSKSNLSAVMDDIYTNPIPMVKYYAAHVKEIKQLSNIIRTLNEKLPMKNASHLKRVHKNSVLICSLEQFSQMGYENVQDYINSFIPELKDPFDYLIVVEVPSRAPLTKNQHLECRLKWSTNFHPTAELESMLSNTYYKIKEINLHRTYMGIAFEIAKIYSSKTNLQDRIESICNAAVVVDPITNSIVAIATDNRNNHPTQHTTMVAIDNVAKTQNGGAWKDEQLTNEMSDTVTKLQQKFPSVTFGARKFVSKKDEADSDLVENSPYLCTGYDIYLIREPCVMCAMGLVHARIKRVFYTFANLSLGALQSKTKLHCLKHLNHRFPVFNGFEKFSV